MDNIRSVIQDGSALMGIELDDEKVSKLIIYARVLKEWNEKINLTAITGDEDIAIKHFLDSLSALCTGKVKGRVIDVGTGAGFPGMVLKIADPGIELTLLDSLNKRVTFLKALGEETECEEVEYVHSRAEDAGQNKLYREKFDTVVSRAVANMTVLSEWCLPFVKPGGYFLALKGPLAEAELNDAKRAIHILGGEVMDIFNVKIPYSDLEHKIIIVKKVRHTPMKFPRKPGIASKTSIESCYNLSKK